jgi:hypothetical protein
MKKIITTLFVCASLSFPIMAAGAASAASAGMAGMVHERHASAMLHEVNGSGVEGFVDLRQLKQGGTHIILLGFGLQPAHSYVSLYYSNHNCNLEPYSADDVIGGIYTANAGGVGFTNGNANDDLDEINSVSIRNAENFNLLACANVHP